MSLKMRAHHRDFMWVLPGQSLSPIKSLSSIRKRGFVVDLFFWAPYILGGIQCQIIRGIGFPYLTHCEYLTSVPEMIRN